MDFSHIIVVAGHYGCGKTNLSINLAHHLAQQGEAVTLVDLDLVNPYFRSSDYQEEMEERGIHVISPLYASTNLDIPALSPEINSVFVKPEGHVIFDVGGDDAGAAALGRFAAKIRESGPYEMLYVINRYRVLTSSAAEAAAILPEIEASSRLKATGIVNNSHLLQDTGQFTFFSQILYTQGFQHLGIRTVRQCLFGSRTDRFQLFLHNIVPFFRRFCGHLALWQYRTKSPDALCAVLPYGKHISKKPCPVKTGQGSRLFKTTHFQRAVTLLSLMRTPHLHLL